MTIYFANWIPLLPVAATLAVIAAISGDLVDRPKVGWLRLSIQVLIWQMIALSIVGVCMRLTEPSSVWIIAAIAFLIVVAIWNRKLAQASLVQILLATDAEPKRLHAVTHYLELEGRGYWRTIGLRLRRELELTGDWAMALRSSQILRDPRSLLAMEIATRYGSRELIREQLSVYHAHRVLLARLRGRLFASLTSLLFVGLASLLFRFFILSTLWKLNAEMQNDISLYLDRWRELTENYGVDILITLVAWGSLGMILMLSWFPILTRFGPLEWPFHKYYRALSLRGLAEIVAVEPSLSKACHVAAYATSVPVWSRRLRRAAQRIDQGESVSSALRRSWLIGRREANTLTLATTPDAMAWSLREISTTATERSLAWASVWVQLLVVGMVLANACYVCLLAMGVIDILASLIHAQS